MICKNNNHTLPSGKDREIWLSGNILKRLEPLHCLKQLTSSQTDFPIFTGSQFKIVIIFIKLNIFKSDSTL